jgi:putative transposase
MAARFGLIVTEELQVLNMSRAPKAKPDAANAGQYLTNGAAAKAGLNRSILDAAPAGFIAKLRYKAEEAGSKFLQVPTRSVKPTQRCHRCGTTQKLGLSERKWVCVCGAHHDRDVNAPRTMLRYAYEGAWWKTEPGAGTAPAALVA